MTIAVGLGILALTLTLRGLVVAVLWMWFITPLGVPAITWPQGLGLTLIAKACVPYFGDEKQSAIAGLAEDLAVTCVCFVLGWFAKLAMG